VTAEATRDLPTAPGEIETPLETTAVRRLSRRVVAVPVLRAGLGMLDAFLELVPSAQVGYFGLERNEQTAVPSLLREDAEGSGRGRVFLLDPMLAQGLGGMAMEGPADLGAPDRLSIVAAPEDRAPEGGPGRHRLHGGPTGAQRAEVHPPGLGDFGDRLFGT
jgi:uracil phosphoribosyltransferase